MAAVTPPDLRARRRFHRRLLAWYARHGRDLPWRRTRDPYRILVSEIMLQQTQVDRVIPKYREFLGRYPTFQQLADARLPDVTRAWYPLGYYRRAKHLHGIARETVARYGGRLPDEGAELRSMGKDAALVDTNVRRVLGRVFLGARRLARLRGERTMWDLAESLVPAGRAYDYNQALMDFGATWCTARKPKCPRCPMKTFCRSYDRAGA